MPCVCAHELGCFHALSCNIRKSPTTHILGVISTRCLCNGECVLLQACVGAHDSGYGLSVGVGNSKSSRYKVPAPDPVCCDMSRTSHEKP